MDQLQNTLIQEGLAFVYQPKDIVLNMTMGFCLGLVISFVYKATHKGLSYSQSFMLTIVFVTFIVSMVMMVIGNNLARAFALVGAWARRASQAPLLRCLKRALRLGKVVLQMLHCVFGVAASEAVPFAAAAGLHIL